MSLSVVHLVRASNGFEPFRAFIESYRRVPAGTEHELAVVLKGFPDREATEPYRALAQECEHWIEISDEGFDLDAYRKAAERLRHEKLVFANSFTILTTVGWLAAMADVGNDPHVGAVSPTGSWGSQASHARWGFGHGLGGAYRHVWDREEAERIFCKLSPPTQPTGGKLKTFQDTIYGLAIYTVSFASFPAPHLRSNCMLVDRVLWLRIAPRETLHDKLEAYRFESGRRGMTERLKGLGLRVLVVGRDGNGYEPERWPASRTFWQSNQENLLVGDNQTAIYQNGNRQLRTVLSSYAWGHDADPGDARVSSPA
jgi:hypothetical protein